MKSLIQFIEEESKRRGRKLSTEEVRTVIDNRLSLYKTSIEELEDLRAKTYQYDFMEETLSKIRFEEVLEG